MWNTSTGYTIYAKPWITTEVLLSLMTNNIPFLNFGVQHFPCGFIKPIYPCQSTWRKLKANSSQALFFPIVIFIQEKSAGGKVICESETDSGYVCVKLTFLVLYFLQHCWTFHIYYIALYHSVFQILNKKFLTLKYFRASTSCLLHEYFCHH